jgi:hypothetical protein
MNDSHDASTAHTQVAVPHTQVAIAHTQAAAPHLQPRNRLDKILAVVPRALSSHVHIIFLACLGVFLVTCRWSA